MYTNVLRQTASGPQLRPVYMHRQTQKRYPNTDMQIQIHTYLKMTISSALHSTSMDKLSSNGKPAITGPTSLAYSFA